jgi:hypothetical protein
MVGKGAKQIHHTLESRVKDDMLARFSAPGSSALLCGLYPRRSPQAIFNANAGFEDRDAFRFEEFALKSRMGFADE